MYNEAWVVIASTPEGDALLGAELTVFDVFKTWKEADEVRVSLNGVGVKWTVRKALLEIDYTKRA